MSEVVIVDYDLGNLFNVQRAFAHIGVKATLTDNKTKLGAADKIVLPGVGAFNEGMLNLERKGLVSIIQKAASQGVHILGICLGMQLLMTESEEYGNHAGLNLIAGNVKQFTLPTVSDDFRIPHTGWNRIVPAVNQMGDCDRSSLHTLMGGLGAKIYMYFAHSYFVHVKNNRHCVAETSYGQNTFSSVVQSGNIIGCQFHPERSGPEGLALLRNFISLK